MGPVARGRRRASNVWRPLFAPNRRLQGFGPVVGAHACSRRIARTHGDDKRDSLLIGTSFSPIWSITPRLATVAALEMTGRIDFSSSSKAISLILYAEGASTAHSHDFECGCCAIERRAMFTCKPGLKAKWMRNPPEMWPLFLVILNLFWWFAEASGYIYLTDQIAYYYLLLDKWKLLSDPKGRLKRFPCSFTPIYCTCLICYQQVFWEATFIGTLF